MTNEIPQSLAKDEADIHALIDGWARAVREENRAEIRANHHAEMLMFDVPPPLFVRGLDGYMATWELFCPARRSPFLLIFATSKSLQVPMSLLLLPSDTA